jgi:hypothetical protein
MYNDIVHTEEFNGFTINILPDTDVQNPFDDWDCEPPLAVYSDRSITEYATGYGEVNRVPYFDNADVLKALPVILELTGKTSIYDLVRTVRQHSTDLTAGIHWEVSDAIDSLSNSDRLEALCSLYNALGIPAVVKTVRGCSQGDYAEVLAVATPEFQEACGNGADFDWIASLEASIQLFEDWAFGNVYGYEVLDANSEHVDSCWGFFGDYDGEYGALSEAKSIVDHRIERERLERIEQIKTWIRNRVPFQYRLTA